MARHVPFADLGRLVVAQSNTTVVSPSFSFLALRSYCWGFHRPSLMNQP